MGGRPDFASGCWPRLASASACQAPAVAAVEIAFYSRELGGNNFPHAFVALHGTVDATGEQVDTSLRLHRPCGDAGDAVRFGARARSSSRASGEMARSHRQFALTLSDERYRAVMAVVERWRNRPQPSYNLNRRNCVHFVAELAETVGLRVENVQRLMKRPRSFLAACAQPQSPAPGRALPRRRVRLGIGGACHSAMFRARNVKRGGHGHGRGLAAQARALRCRLRAPAAARRRSRRRRPPAGRADPRGDRSRPPPEPTEAPTARLTVEGGVERAPCALDRPEYREYPLHPARRRLRRSARADRRRSCAPAFAPYVGQEHNVAVICEIRDRAATILREAGYIAAVEVPEQRIADGDCPFRGADGAAGRRCGCAAMPAAPSGPSPAI